MLYEVQLWGCVSALLGLPAELIPQSWCVVPDDVDYYTSPRPGCQQFFSFFLRGNAALIVEQILLHDAGLLAVGGEGVAPTKFFVDETLDPDVDGGHRGAAIAEEADAVGDFFADAVQREQAGKEGVVGENGQRIEVEGAGGGLRGGVLDVAGAVAQPAARQLRFREAAELLRGGEEEDLIALRTERLAAAPGQLLDGGADGRDALALGDDEGDEHLPRVLTQHPDALPEGQRCVEIGALARQTLPQGGVAAA